ncbi:MAG: nucleoside triphosphate pyrophosphohydrolase [Gammaproteobacteria bacterium]
MSQASSGNETGIEALLALMARLRDPQAGCPWDREQTLESIVPHTIEEAYEVAEAIETGMLEGLADELGDLLFQVVFYARIAEEAGIFDFAAVVSAIRAKLVRRHPHVFAGAPIADAQAQARAWEQHKRAERGAHAQGALAGVALALPALTRAAKLQRRAATVGFDWPAPGPVFAKVREELGELEQALDGGHGSMQVQEECGDLLFACVNLARHLGVDPERALRSASRKFERRFAAVESGLSARGLRPDEATLAQMDALWEDAKARERDGAPPTA